MSSPSESGAIIVATVECLRYCLMQHAGDDPQQRSVQSMLISEQVRAPSSHRPNTHLAQEIILVTRPKHTWHNRSPSSHRPNTHLAQQITLVTTPKHTWHKRSPSSHRPNTPGTRHKRKERLSMTLTHTTPHHTTPHHTTPHHTPNHPTTPHPTPLGS